jgi:hypothetical protein
MSRPLGCPFNPPPRAGRDLALAENWILCSNFNPPSPCGEGQYSEAGARFATIISIHPPRAGRDYQDARLSMLEHHFNPPSPCGEGHRTTEFHAQYLKFQSTLPVRGGTLTIFPK